MNLQEMRDDRLKKIADARKVVEKAAAEKRSMNAEEQGQFDTMMKDAAKLKDDVGRIESLEAEERANAQPNGRKTAPPDPNGRRDGDPVKIEYRGQTITIHRDMRDANRRSVYARANGSYDHLWSEYLRDPKAGDMQIRTANSLSNDVAADGGFLHAPVQFNIQLIKAIDNNTVVRKRARVLPVTTSDTLGTPTFSTLYASANWTTELQAISPDATGQFTRRDLKPNLLTKAILVSTKLMKTSAIPPEEIVTDEFGRIFGYAEENGFLTGTGTTQPLGAFVASASGVDTSRDVVAGTTTAFTFDGLQAVKYGMKAQYRNGASWLFHRTCVSLIAQLKDSQGRYIWEPSGQAGTPDMLLGFPVDESEFAPNTMTTGLYVGMFANWRYYWIADLVTGMEFQQLNELYALSNQTGFVGRRYVDGQPVLAEAFSRAKLA